MKFLKSEKGGDGSRYARSYGNMQRFFFDDENIVDNRFEVSGEKFNHIARSLRMSLGEKAVFCDGESHDFECKLLSLDSEKAYFEITDSYENETEPKLKITVFQCLPKGEKMDDTVKRCVQFGAYEIVPVLSKRCVSRPDGKSAEKKIERLNKISRSSAMQSMRGRIPKVTKILSFNEAVQRMKLYPQSFICYENEMNRTLDSVNFQGGETAFLIGPEGGLDISEIEYAADNNVRCISLGKRILRTEDAAAFLIPILLFSTGNL